MWITDDGRSWAGVVYGYVFDIRTCSHPVDGGGVWFGFKPCQVLYECDIHLLCSLLPWQFLCRILSRAWHGTGSGLWYHPAYFNPRNLILCVDQTLGAGGGRFCYRSRVGSSGAFPVDTVPESCRQIGNLTPHCTIFTSSNQTSSSFVPKLIQKEARSFILQNMNEHCRLLAYDR